MGIGIERNNVYLDMKILRGQRMIKLLMRQNTKEVWDNFRIIHALFLLRMNLPRVPLYFHI